jgi:hypothetical protein
MLELHFRAEASTWLCGSIRRVARLLTGVFLASLLLGCASRSNVEIPREPALPLLFVENGKLGWGGITLGMTRAATEEALGGGRLTVRHDSYVDVCGEYFSTVERHGRSIRIDWSAATPEGVVDVIAVPYGGAERMAYDEDLSQAAVAAVPELVPQVDEESETAHADTHRFSSCAPIRSRPST